jgi:hypothetical protein
MIKRSLSVTVSSGPGMGIHRPLLSIPRSKADRASNANSENGFPCQREFGFIEYLSLHKPVFNESLPPSDEAFVFAHYVDKGDPDDQDQRDKRQMMRFAGHKRRGTGHNHRDYTGIPQDDQSADDASCGWLTTDSASLVVNPVLEKAERAWNLAFFSSIPVIIRATAPALTMRNDKNITSKVGNRK